MPVQSEYYSRIKPVCDRLAVLASECYEKEFKKRFNMLKALCESWAQSTVHQKAALAPSSGSACQENGAKVDREISPEVDSVLFTQNGVNSPSAESLLTDNGNKEPNNDYVHSQLGK